MVYCGVVVVGGVVVFHVRVVKVLSQFSLQTKRENLPGACVKLTCSLCTGA